MGRYVLEERAGYRADIDGLRAVAVLAVVVYHAFPRVLPGGYLGVDAFFVVSGYLITGLLARDLAQGGIRLRGFYARRVRRILPALVLVLASCAVWGWFRLLADEHASLGKHLLASATFSSNFVLRWESGYFDAAAQTKPLLHLWSLAVEEQFYLVWPLLLALAWRWGRPALAVCALAAVSLGVQWWFSAADPSSAFYLPQARFWELAAGGALALGGDRLARLRSDRWAATMGILGMGLLLTSFVVFSQGRFLSPVACMCAVAGTSLVVASGPGGWISSRILSRRPLVGIGLVSYPLYLWHWPLLSFASIEVGLPSKGARIALVLLSGLLAWLTWWLVERKVRYARGAWTVPLLLSALVACGAWGGWILARGGWEGTGFRLPEKTAFARAMDNTPPAWHYFHRTDMLRKYRRDCDFYDLEAFRDGHASSRPVDSLGRTCTERDPRFPHSVLLWGDSHSAMLRMGLDAHLDKSWQILQVATSGCDPDPDPAGPGSEEFCRVSNRVALEVVARAHPEVVVVSQFKGHDARKLAAIADRLESMGVGRVVFTGPSPHWVSELPRLILRKHWDPTPERSREDLDPAVFAVDSLLRRELSGTPGRRYVSLSDVLCDGNGCLTRIGPDRLEGIVTWDQSHLTPLASELVARKSLVEAITGP